MKGLIFTEFLEFVEQQTSYEIVDKIIIKSNLQNDGAYTSLGTYDSQQILQLVKAFSEETHIPSSEILIEYGKFLFKKFSAYYPYLFKKKSSTFQFLSSIENYIHIEVHKLYKDAELPHFECSQITPTKFVMLYSSTRPFADLAEGLIKGCINYHNEKIEVIREDIPATKGYKSKFTLISNPRVLT
ncbi:MAG: guanylate cyclase [Gammaproteobacteria bacterium RIFCSPHIGHO2_12_FULL_37_14]|nr:MAG: guanylate cyclase [Gammaproteobacteria bacterium RIFCSPHIGHO2_12_FULL_37_14]